MSILGIDVASGQSVNWSQIKKDGYQFALIKASEGFKDNSDEDIQMKAYFDSNVKQANDAGILCGAYHFLSATNTNTGSAADNYSAETQAKFFIENVQRVGGFNAIKLPLCIDIEDKRYEDVNKKDKNTAIAKAFALEISKAGFLPCLYLNKNFMDNFYNMNEFGDLLLWYAHHGVPEATARLECPNAWCWQSGVFQINGITQTGPEKGTDKDYSFVEFLPQNNSTQAVFPYMQTKTDSKVYIDYCNKIAYAPRGYSTSQIRSCIRLFSKTYNITVQPDHIALDDGTMERQSYYITYYGN